MTLEELKIRYLDDLSEDFNLFSERPRAKIKYDNKEFYVDAGYKDLQNFQVGKDLQIDFIIDVDDNTIDISSDINGYYDTIIKSIKIRGLEIMQQKWNYKKQILEAESIEDLNNIEINFI